MEKLTLFAGFLTADSEIAPRGARRDRIGDIFPSRPCLLISRCQLFGTPVPIVGCVSPALRSRLLSVLPATIACDSWSHVEAAVRKGDGAILFVDPAAVDRCVDSVLRLRERYPSVAVVVYTALGPEAFHDVMRLARAGISDVVLRGFDEKRDRLLRLVDDAVARMLPALDVLEPSLKRLPAPMERAVKELFRDPRRFRSTLDLAAAAGISPRAVFRHLKAAGFSSPRRLVASARVIRAHQLLAGGGRSGQDVAARLRYRSVDQLSQHLVELGSCTATDIKRGRAPSDFVAVVLRSLTTPGRRTTREAMALAA